MPRFLGPPTALLSEDTPAVYVSLLSAARPSESSLRRAGYSPAFIERELGRLSDLGMVRVLDGGAIEVIPPEVALPKFAGHLEEQAAAARASIDELAARYRRSRGQRRESVTFEVRVVSDLAELDEARRRVMSDAEESVVVIAARTPSNERLLMDDALAQPGLRGPGTSSLTRHLVLDRSILQLDGALAQLEALDGEGVDVRLHPQLALSVLIVDRAVAIVDITNLDPSGYGSILVRHPPLVEGLARLADATVRSSALAPIASPAARKRLEDREATTLALLAAGASDITIARQMGVSQRTVERHVRRLMDHLGADTRFQAGVEAARRGLI